MKDLMVGQPRKYNKSRAKNPNFKFARFSLYGFPQVLQVWAYESLPALGSAFAQRVGNSEIPFLNWKADGFYHASSIYDEVFKDDDAQESEDDEVKDEHEEEDEADSHEDEHEEVQVDLNEAYESVINTCIFNLSKYLFVTH
ncbi:unnamed protein product [Cuscuta epithymum]|uniref:Uncharacterized protein n=1 Tax=Cuscuta epithymum TaxID=186058 RepID=A0AAV0DYC0_9ASTE|nr:unnamed protein product [Cuscuta epithymum]